MDDRTGQVYKFLRSYHKKHGIAPTFREIGQACGINSTSNVRYHLDLLERAGLIERKPGVARGIVVKGVVQ